jgi:hypothetical protein
VEEEMKTISRSLSKKLNVKSFLSQNKNEQMINFLKMKEEQDSYLLSKFELYMFYAARGISCAFLFTPLSNNILTKYFVILCFLTCCGSFYSNYLQMRLKSNHQFAISLQEMAYMQGFGRASIVFISLTQVLNLFFAIGVYLYIVRAVLSGLNC